MVYREMALDACPSCRHLLHPLSLRGFDLARCMDCGGVWIDLPTLEELWRWAGMPAELFHFAPAVPERERPCPRCRRGMRFVNLLVVRLDQCTSCGVWFDGQELETALAYPESRSDRDWLRMFAMELDGLQR